MGNMKAIVTGASGTLGQVLTRHLEAHNWQVTAWERRRYPVGDWETSKAFLDGEEPHAIFHLASDADSSGIEKETWLVNVEWSRWLAAQALAGSALFVFTSSVMVWSDQAMGPFTLQSASDVQTGYGHEKRQAEIAVLDANPDAVVTRLGWQMGHAVGGRHMLDHIEQHLAQHGKLSASQAWFPACSFLEDTAAALLRLCALPGDIYLLDSNKGWTYFEIVQAMKDTYDKDWVIEPADDLVFNQRMLDPRPQMPSLSQRLPMLPGL